MIEININIISKEQIAWSSHIKVIRSDEGLTLKTSAF